MTPQQTIETESSDTTSFGEWAQANSRAIGIGALIILIAAGGYWYYLRSAEIKRANAERQLNQAKQSLTAGNAALAQSDLQKVAQRYQGTTAGAQAAMILAQLNYDQGKFVEGIRALEPYQTAAAAGPALAAIWSLTGDGQMSSGKAADAVGSFRKAADATTMPGEKALALAKEGRALMAAGNEAEAKKLWQKLATDPTAAPVRNEAEVRLGELEAKSAGKS